MSLYGSIAKSIIKEECDDKPEVQATPEAPAEAPAAAPEADDDDDDNYSVDESATIAAMAEADIENAAKFGSVEELVEFMECLIEASADAYDAEEVVSSLDEAAEEALFEGANLDSRAAFKQCKKEFKAQTKICKKALKDGDYAAAKKCTAKMHQAVAEATKAIKATESDAGSLIFGFYASGLARMAEALVPAITGGVLYGAGAGATVAGVGTANIALTVAGGAAAFASWIPLVIASLKELIRFIKEVITFAENLKDDTPTMDKINRYKNTLLSMLKDFDKKVSNLEKCIAKKQGASK